MTGLNAAVELCTGQKHRLDLSLKKPARATLLTPRPPGPLCGPHACQACIVSFAVPDSICSGLNVLCIYLGVTALTPAYLSRVVSPLLPSPLAIV